jgi:glycosyltransferase involved in cell wall biosynthesis
LSPHCKRVAIFFWDGHLAVAPSLVSALQLLAAAGYEVDVFIRGLGDAIGPLGEIPLGVHIFDLASARRLSSGLSRRWLPARLGVGAGVFLYLVFAWKQARRRHYSAIFGVDAIGGYCGQRIASWFRLPFFYWSLELLFARDARRLYERLLIHCGRVATRHARWIVIQDSERAKALLAENQPGHERILLVPNGPAGPANLGRSDFLQRRFHIPRETRIVLHAGMIGDWVLSHDIARSIHAWPPEFCMVMHSNEPRRADEPDIEQLTRVGEPRLILSLDPVAASDVDDLISSASVGLATYGKGLGPNWDLIVYASGKLGHYLRNGLPVICSDHPGMRELMAQYRCGIAIESVDEIAAALSEISANYAAYRAGALDCYRRRYEFSAHFGAVLDALARECGAPVEPAEKVLAWK